MVEQWPFKPLVPGSSPGPPTKKKTRIISVLFLIRARNACCKLFGANNFYFVAAIEIIKESNHN